MLVGYMRVSSADDRQSVDLQRDALIAVGIHERHLYADKAWLDECFVSLPDARSGNATRH